MAKLAANPANPASSETGLVPQQSGKMQLVDSELDFRMSQEEEQQIGGALQANIDPSELQISRFSMLQPLSPEIKDKAPGYAEGMIIDNATREIYSTFGPPPWMVAKGIDPAKLESVHYVRIVPVFKLPTEYIKWKDRKKGEGKGMHWKSLDPTEQRVKEGIWSRGGTFKSTPEQKAPPVTENINILTVPVNEFFEPLSGFVINTYSKTSFNTGRKFVTALQTHAMYRLPYWGKVYYLYTHYERKDDNAYYVFQIARGDQPSDPLLIEMCKGMALWLSDPKEGVERQKNMIMRAIDETDEHDDEGTTVEGQTIGGNAANDPAF